MALTADCLLVCDSIRCEKQEQESIGVGVGIGIGIELLKTDSVSDPEYSPGVTGYSI